jgi:hypothetical protein
MLMLQCGQGKHQRWVESQVLLCHSKNNSRVNRSIYHIAISHIANLIANMYNSELQKSTVLVVHDPPFTLITCLEAHFPSLASSLSFNSAKI